MTQFSLCTVGLLTQIFRASPTPFYIYPTVKLVYVPALTHSYGQRMCAASSAIGTGCDQSPVTLSGLNSYLGMYRSNAQGSDELLAPSTTMDIDTHTTSSSGISQASSAAFTSTEVTLATPFFFYLPVQTDTESAGGGQDIGVQLFGYVPQDLIDSMKQNPSYMSQFPQLSSCQPGGFLSSSYLTMSENSVPLTSETSLPAGIYPSGGPGQTQSPGGTQQIPGTNLPLPGQTQAPGGSQIPGGTAVVPESNRLGPSAPYPAAAPAPHQGGPLVNPAVPGLTSSTAVTVSSRGCFHPESCIPQATPSNTPVVGTPSNTAAGASGSTPAGGIGQFDLQTRE